jgi:hypothetical protein
LVAEDAKPSLLDLAREQNVGPGPRCKLAAPTTTHPQAEQIRELIAACPSEIQYSTAQRVLKGVGIEISADSISRHARGICSCPS